MELTFSSIPWIVLGVAVIVYLVVMTSWLSDNRVVRLLAPILILSAVAWGHQQATLKTFDVDVYVTNEFDGHDISGDEKEGLVPAGFARLATQPTYGIIHMRGVTAIRHHKSELIFDFVDGYQRVIPSDQVTNIAFDSEGTDT